MRDFAKHSKLTSRVIPSKRWPRCLWSVTGLTLRNRGRGSKKKSDRWCTLTNIATLVKTLCGNLNYRCFRFTISLPACQRKRSANIIYVPKLQSILTAQILLQNFFSPFDTRKIKFTQLTRNILPPPPLLSWPFTSYSSSPCFLAYFLSLQRKLLTLIRGRDLRKKKMVEERKKKVKVHICE